MNKQPMSKERLEGFYDKRVEVAVLEQRISEMPDMEDYADVVNGSTGAGYTMRRIIIRGRGESVIKKRHEVRLAKKEKELSEEFEAIVEFIESFADGGTRQILEVRYIDGKTIEETAELVHRSKSNVKQRLKEFFEKTGLE